MCYSLTIYFFRDSSIFIIVYLLRILIETRSSWDHLMSNLLIVVLLISQSVRALIIFFTYCVSCIYWTWLVPLISLWQLLRSILYVKIIWSCCKLFYIILRHFLTTNLTCFPLLLMINWASWWTYLSTALQRSDDLTIRPMSFISYVQRTLIG